MDNTYALFGWDAESGMIPFTQEGVTVSEAKKFARDNRLGSYFIAPSTREQYPNYGMMHYLLGKDGEHHPVVHYKWLAETFAFTEKFPPKDSALYKEVYGE